MVMCKLQSNHSNDGKHKKRITQQKRKRAGIDAKHHGFWHGNSMGLYGFFFILCPVFQLPSFCQV